MAFRAFRYWHHGRLCPDVDGGSPIEALYAPSLDGDDILGLENHPVRLRILHEVDFHYIAKDIDEPALCE